MVVCILNAVFRIPDGVLTSLACSVCAVDGTTWAIKTGSGRHVYFLFLLVRGSRLSGLTHGFRSWHELYMVSSIPSLLFVVAVLSFLLKSPRWYFVLGRIGVAMKLMRIIAKENGNILLDGVILGLVEVGDDNKKEGQDHADTKDAITGSLVNVKSPLTQYHLLLVVRLNFPCLVVYYGISLNVTNLKTNLYLNVFLNGIAETPAFLITALLLDRFGRKLLAHYALVQWLVLPTCKGLRMACGVLGIFRMAGTYNLLFIYSTKLFPTVVRNVAFGWGRQAAQLGAILAPLVVVVLRVESSPITFQDAESASLRSISFFCCPFPI